MNIQFKNLKDEKPKHDSHIVYIHVSGFYDTWEFKFAEVEYSWDDLDGTQVCYDPDDSSPEEEGYELFIGFDGYYEPFNSTMSLMWAYIDDVNDLLEKEGL